MTSITNAVRTLLCALAAVALAAPAPPPLEIPNASPDELRERASDVVTGELLAVYERKLDDGAWQVTVQVAEVRIDEVEKGELTAGDLVYARFWQRRWDSWFTPMPADTNGHRGVPAPGANVRLHLIKRETNFNDKYFKPGGFNVVAPNGIESL